LPNRHSAGEELVEADFAGVALGEGIGRYQARLLAIIEQGVGVEQEIRDEIGAPADTTADDTDKILTVSRSKSSSDSLSAQERRVSDDSVEATLV
jgi:hypothetical protein